MNIAENFLKVIMKYIPEDKLTEFEILLEVGDEERIQEFIGTIIPDIDQIIDKHIEEILPRTYPPLNLE